MRTWRGTGIISTMRRTKTWACRWGVEWSRVRVSGSSNSASRAWGCAGVRTDLTICCISDSPGSTARLRRCFRYSSNHPPTRNYAQNLEEMIIPSGKVDEVRVNPHYHQYQHVRKPTLSLLYLGFNTQMKPFDDWRVRQAFNYAVNKEVIVREIARMGHVPAVGALPPWLFGYDSDLRGYDYNPAKARELLAAAGYPNGTGFPVVQLWSNHQAASTQAGLAAYQRYLADIGVRLEIRFAPDWQALRARLEQGTIPMFRLLWTADFPDPDNMLFPLLHSASSTNRTFYRNPRVDQLLEQARQELDEAQRIALYHEVERIVLHDAPWITQQYPVLEYLYQPYVQGVELSWLGKRDIPLHKIWLNKGPASNITKAMTNGVLLQ